MMSLDTLLLLRRCLHSQQLNVGDPTFPTVAAQVLTALRELDDAIDQASSDAVG